MSWKTLNKELPPYYEYVDVELVRGNIITVWRAWADEIEMNVYTEADSDEVYFDEHIERWKKIKK